MNFDTFDTFDVKNGINAKSSTLARETGNSRQTCQTCQGEHISPPPALLWPQVSVGEHRADNDCGTRGQKDAPRGMASARGRIQERMQTLYHVERSPSNEGDTMLIAEPQVRTDQDAEATFERARADVRDLQAALAALPEAYKQAVKRGNAADMRAARVSKMDIEEQLIVARILVARAETTLLDDQIAALGPREQAAGQAVQEAFAVTKIKQAELESAIAASNRRQGDAVVIRGEREELVGWRMDLRERLKALTAIELPE